MIILYSLLAIAMVFSFVCGGGVCNDCITLFVSNTNSVFIQFVGRGLY
jgi:hypothetical protein